MNSKTDVQDRQKFLVLDFNFLFQLGGSNFNDLNLDSSPTLVTSVKYTSYTSKLIRAYFQVFRWNSKIEGHKVP